MAGSHRKGRDGKSKPRNTMDTEDTKNTKRIKSKFERCRFAALNPPVKRGQVGHPHRAPAKKTRTFPHINKKGDRLGHLIERGNSGVGEIREDARDAGVNC